MRTQRIFGQFTAKRPSDLPGNDRCIMVLESKAGTSAVTVKTRQLYDIQVGDIVALDVTEYCGFDGFYHYPIFQGSRIRKLPAECVEAL